MALCIYTYSLHAVYHLVPARFRDCTSAGAILCFWTKQIALCLIQIDHWWFWYNPQLHYTALKQTLCPADFAIVLAAWFNRTIAWIKDIESKPAVSRLMPWLIFDNYGLGSVQGCILYCYLHKKFCFWSISFILQNPRLSFCLWQCLGNDAYLSAWILF